jgi:DNA-directed RNA polymerase specialized sigma24 family protein
VSPTAVPQRSEPGAWLARYGELQNSLFVTLARPLGMARAGGRDAFDDLFQIAATAAWIRERDGEPIRNPRAFLRQVIINQRKMQLRSERRHPATSYDEIMVTAEGDGGSGIDAVAERRPSVTEQVERREVAEIVTHILLTVERCARTVRAMRWLEDRTPDEVVAALGITLASTRGCSSARTPRSTASCWPTWPATGAGDTQRGSRGWRRTGRRRPRRGRRANIWTPARAAARRTRRSRGCIRAARDVTERAARVARDRASERSRPTGASPVMATIGVGSPWRACPVAVYADAYSRARLMVTLAGPVAQGLSRPGRLGGLTPSLGCSTRATRERYESSATSKARRTGCV